MSGSQVSSLLEKLIILGTIAIWIIILCSFFIKPVLFPSPTVLQIAFGDVRGQISIDRPLTFLNDCANLAWEMSNTDQVQLNAEEVGAKGNRQFCAQGLETAFTFSVFSAGIEKIYRIAPVFLWRQSTSMIYLGTGIIACLLVLFAYVLRFPPIFLTISRIISISRPLRDRAAPTMLAVWVCLSLFIYWEMRGSPGLIPFVTFLEDARLWLRTLFTGVF